MSNAIILADILEAAGLAGPEPIRAARALLATLERQPGADADPAAAHGAMAVVNLRRYGAALLAEATPDAAMLLLARCVAAGMPYYELLDYLPAQGRRAA